MIVELQIYFSYVALFLVKNSQFVGPVGYFRNLQKSTAHLLQFVLLLYTYLCLQLLFLWVDLHREGLVPLEMLLLHKKRSCLKFLLPDCQLDEGPFPDWIKSDSLNDCGLDGSLGSVAVIFEFCLLFLVLKNMDGGRSSFFAHVWYITVDFFVDVVFILDVDKADPHKFVGSIHFAPKFTYYTLHLWFWKLEWLVEDKLIICCEDWFFFCLVIELSVLEDNKRRCTHIFRPNIVERHRLDLNVESRHLHYFLYFDQGHVNECDTLFVLVKNL